MSDALVELTRREIESFRPVRRQNPTLFPREGNLHPIPFFGDLQGAEVLTLGLNPSHTEFAQERNWPPEIETSALTNRLTGYFRHDEVSAHRWFTDLEMGMLQLDCSYKRNAAHIDLMPFPTLRPRELSDDQRRTFAKLVTEHARRLDVLLALAPAVKLVLVVDYRVRAGNGQWLNVFDEAKANSRLFEKVVSARGAYPRIAKGQSPADLAQAMIGQQFELREVLKQRPIFEEN